MAGQITALQRQRGRRERINVMVDGRFAFSADPETVLTAGLKVGMILDDAAVARLHDQDEAVRLFNDALRFLSFRPRSSIEVERYLRGRGADEATSASILERLQRTELIDDQAFARYWVENRATFSPRGDRALQAELRAKGVAGAEIDAVLEETGESEEDRAYRAGQKRLRLLARLDPESFRRRMYAFLQRRGFDYETSRSATERLWAESGSGDGSDAGADAEPYGSDQE
jgi:regulatory protein